MKLSLLLKKGFKKAKKTDLVTAAAVVSLLVTGLGVLLTYIFTNAATLTQQQNYTNDKRQQFRTTANYINAKMTNYSQILLAGATAVNVKGPENLTREDWKTFYNTSLAPSAFPEIFGIGYAKVFPASDLEEVTQSVRNEGFAEFSVNPVRDTDRYSSILYIEPFSEVTSRAFGYDMFSESRRRDAMQKAEKENSFALTAPVVLKQDEQINDAVKPKSVLLYYPIFSSRTPREVSNGSSKELVGYVYLALRLQDMMADRNKDIASQKISYEIADTANGHTDVYRFAAPGSTTRADDTIAATIPVSSRQWNITMHIPQTNAGPFPPVRIFWIGLGMSMVLGAMVYSVLRLRINRIHLAHESELERTRDELLALSSHQLRTPASGVKQYLGMLLQGYFGTLSSEQKTIAEKAYTSNERQLEIIDQLLYVAKADANQLALNTELINISAVLSDVVEGMKDIAEKKNISFTQKIPGEIHVLADERFIRMIFENLISNAIKYSYEKSSIKLRLASHGEEIRFTVHDKGVGIPKADQEKLFKKFSRIQNELSTKEGGSGLGLYLAQKLAQAHGGDIKIQSNEKGTSFCLVLPRYTKTSQNVIQLTD